jgi:hypothetical protein
MFFGFSPPQVSKIEEQSKPQSLLAIPPKTPKHSHATSLKIEHPPQLEAPHPHSLSDLNSQ